MKLLATFGLALLLAAPALADSKALVTEPGLVELRVDKPDGIDVSLSWEPRSPVDLQYRTYEDSTVMVFHASAGQRITVMSEMILWDTRRVEKTTWIVTVRGTDPDPPEPPGPTPPDPPPPVPPDVSDSLGIGAQVYQAAQALNQPANVEALANTFRELEQRLHEGRTIAADAVAQINAALSANPPVQALGPVINDTFRAAMQKYGAGQTAVKSMVHEARLALEAVSRPQREFHKRADSLGGLD